MSRALLLVGALALLAASGCTERKTLGAQCSLNSECNAPLVCGFGRCRTECATIRDCPIGAICLPVEPRGGVCSLPDEDSCAVDGDCPEDLVCRDRQCTVMCVEDRDCVGAICVDSVCVDPTERACTHSDECGGMLVCLEGRCLPQCRSDRDCPEGAACLEGTCSRIDGGPPDAGPPDLGPIDLGPPVIATCTMPEDCRAPNATDFGCEADMCTITGCAEGFADCDGSYESGCEIDLRIDPAHCGACDAACGVGGSCAEGSCDGIAAVDAGESHLCALRDNGRILCTGGNYDGELGVGAPIFELLTTPMVAEGVEDATQVEVALNNVCALRGEGRVSCTGLGNRGQIGDGHWTTRYVHTFVEGIGGPDADGAVELSMEYGHGCARLETGRVVCWGWGEHGELGHGLLQSENRPVEVAGITDAVAVATGDWSTCVVHETGAVSCVGSNRHGVLGDGLTTHEDCDGTDCSLTPVTVSDLTDAVDIVGGYDHYCALRSTGEVACWGSGAFDLGANATENPQRTPVAVPGIDDAVQLTAYSDVTCARRADGSAACFGYNYYGFFGDGTTDDSATPVPVEGLTDATDITVQYAGACAVSASRGMICWGYNEGYYGTLEQYEYWHPPRAVPTFNP